MAKNELIDVFCFGTEIGRLGMDENQQKSYFQYHPDFIKNNLFPNLFPDTGIIKRVVQNQVFSTFNNNTFKGLPPMIADSLPDHFGNLILKTWLASKDKNFTQLSVLEQLTYVGNRGMGALEYRPRKEIPITSTINLTEIIEVLAQVISQKETIKADNLTHNALLNIFKMGSSAGGLRPKILIAENIKTGEIIPGDLNFASDHHHYLVKLAIDNELGYPRELIEYSYYLTAIQLEIRMMPSHLIENQHFATKRFDRQNGKKQHILTASGLTGWDFQNTKDSSYENLFELALFLKIPHSEIEELFRRMVFNIVFANTDDHLKNHSFIYDEESHVWHLSPAYDLTYALNPLINYKRAIRALSVNDKRVDINNSDVLALAEKYTIKNAQNTITQIQDAIQFWAQTASALDISPTIIQSMQKDFVQLV
jgi:serine/threonine-protein kinase HipA